MPESHDDAQKTSEETQLSKREPSEWRWLPLVTGGMVCWGIIYLCLSVTILVLASSYPPSITVALPFLLFGGVLIYFGIQLAHKPKEFYSLALIWIWLAFSIGTLWIWLIWFFSSGLTADAFHDPQVQSDWLLFTQILGGWTLLTAFFSILATNYLRKRVRINHSTENK